MADSSPGPGKKDISKQSDRDSKDIEAARARFKFSADSESDLRTLSLADLEFRAGNQWPASVKNERQMDGRPCLVINRIPQFIRQITNDQRQNRPSIKVSPIDDKGDVETARVLQGLIRHIEYNSGADVAYDTAFDHAVTSGRGFFRIVNEYCDPRGFEQEIKIKRIPNQFTVYWDPAAREPDGSDAQFCFIAEDLTLDEFKTQYPDAEPASLEEFKGIGDDVAKYWAAEGKVRVAEYYYIEHVERNLALLSTGDVVEEDEDDQKRAQHEQELAAQGITIAQRRRGKIPVVRWLKMNGRQVLEREDSVFRQWIPVIPVIGEEIDVNGRLILAGVVRNAMDAQRMYNYWVSAETEAIALAPRAPYIGAEGQFEGHEAMWAQANRKNLPFLQYKPVALNGMVVPPPQRQVFEAPVQAITLARGQAADDLKATTGIYDAALGARSNENSGVAIQRRNQQSQTSNFHFVDNLTRSLRHAGRIIIEAIPRVYDSARTIRIIGDDTEQSLVHVNQPELPQGATQKQPIMLADAGRYDVAVETGPSYATKRQEAVATMLDLAQKLPQLNQAAPDLLVKNLDVPGAQDIAERLKKMLPPQLLDDPKNKQPLPPQAQQQLQQMSQMIEGLTQQLNVAHDELDKKKIEIESRERIEMRKLEVQAEIELARLGSKEGLALLSHEIAELTQRRSLDHASDQAERDRAAIPTSETAQQEAAEPSEPTGGSAPGNPMEQMP